MSTDTASSEQPSEIEINDGADLHLDLAQIEAGLDDLKDISMDSNELARQLEDLTGVVLNSAEASTRSASVAADVSGDLQKVMASINAAHQRSVSHSRIMLGAMLIFILILFIILSFISSKSNLTTSSNIGVTIRALFNLSLDLINLYVAVVARPARSLILE